MTFKYFICLISSTLCALLFISCASGKPNLASLVKTVDAYHRDLLFERYDIAAKRISPSGRMKWLESMNAQGIRFSEIDILSTEACPESSHKDVPACAHVLTQMQWYSPSSPSVQSGRVNATWEYDKESGQWLIVEQSQL